MKGKIKLVIWDLDNTLWKGVISEEDNIVISEEIQYVIKKLDERGILQSIASKNDYERAMHYLKIAGIEEYFLYPQINWNPKSENINYIIKKLNLGSDAVAFIDDQEFELSEVKFHIPEITCIKSENIPTLLQRKDMIPEYITNDSYKRRIFYLNDQKRNEIEKNFAGTSEEFLCTLGMVLNLKRACKEDLMRCAELTVRTHQLNSTGYTYTFDELANMLNDRRYILGVAELNDIYGEYGKIGVMLIKKNNNKSWTLKLLLTSCRVISRGIGSAILKWLINYTIKQHIELYAEFVPTNRNRIMEIMYSSLGFSMVDRCSELEILQCNRKELFEMPAYLEFKPEIIMEE